MPSLLGDQDAAVNIAVRNLEVARRFYADTLGLQLIREEANQLLTFRAGRTVIYVYKSEFAGTNKATTLTWSIGLGPAFYAIIANLQASGVTFEHYPDLPGLTLEGDVHVADSYTLHVAWFKDPDGNILSVATS